LGNGDGREKGKCQKREFIHDAGFNWFWLNVRW
jgi:hypothetical protein